MRKQRIYNGNGNISQLAIIDKTTNAHKIDKKYLMRSFLPFFVIKVRTSDVQILKISINTK